MTEAEFLKSYDENEYKRMSVAVDAVVFRIKEDLSCLQVLLRKRKEHPHKGKLSLLGTFVGYEESAETTITRLLYEKIPDNVYYMEQLCTMSEPNRDVRTRVLSIAYMLLVPYNMNIDDSDLEWYDITLKKESIILSNEEMSVEYTCCDVTQRQGNICVNVLATSSSSKFHFAFDHARILATAIERLRGKLTYTDLGFALVPKEFTLPDLQRVYEIILNKKMTSKTQFKSSLVGKIQPLNRKEKSVIGNKLSMLYKYVYERG